jgi:serine protease Do
MWRNFNRTSRCCLFVFSVMIGAGSSVSCPVFAQQPASTASPASRVVIENPSPSGENFVTRAVDRIGSAIVRIDAYRPPSAPSPAPTPQRQGGLAPSHTATAPTGSPRPSVVRGSGSGFVIEEDGLIVTNAHVVGNSRSVTVTLLDGRQISGTVLGRNTKVDIAIVQVAEDLPVAKLANSDQTMVGEWAIAIGNPLGLTNTVTVGVVSGIERDVAILGERTTVPIPYIQTDVAINPGSSGSPLINSRGEVIGINTAIVGGSQGLNFALPSNFVRQLVDQILVIPPSMEFPPQAPASASSQGGRSKR